MQAPTPKDIDSVQAPAALRALKQWLIWRIEPNPNGPKPRKMPYYAWSGDRRGKHNTPDDIRQLVGFSEAKAAAKKKGPKWGVGLAMVAGSPVTALDFDRCVTVAEDGTPTVAEEVDRMIAGTYAEISPSGTGVRAFVQGVIGNGRQAHHDEWQYGLELFNATGFVTFTGNVTETTKLLGDENTVSIPTPELLEHIEKRFRRIVKDKQEPEDGTFEIPSPRVGMSIDELREMLSHLDPNMSNTEWHQLGLALHHETEGSAEGCALWDEWSAGGNGYPGTDYFEHRWEGFDSSKPNAIRIVSYFKEAQANAAAKGESWAIPGTGALASVIASAEDFEEIPGEPKKQITTGTFKIRKHTDFMKEVKTPAWIVKGFIPKATYGMIYGESGSGKSFITYDICAAIVRGEEWQGKKVKKGRVLYVVAEGQAGFVNRGRAYVEHQGIQHSDLDNLDYITDRVPNLINAEVVRELIADIRLQEPYDLIVMDTFAQVTSGANENSGQDMGVALSHCALLHQMSGAMVLLVHHSGKDASRGARGHSSIWYNSDLVLEVNRAQDLRSVTVMKVKDGQDGEEFGFKLNTVVLGQDEDGDDITSCTVDYTDSKGVKGRRKGGLHKNEKAVLLVLNNLCSFDPSAKVAISELISVAVSDMPMTENAKKDNRARDVKRCIQSLSDKNMLIQEGEYVRLPEESNPQ